MFIAVVATTTLLTGGICIATCINVDPAVEHHGLVVDDLARRHLRDTPLGVEVAIHPLCEGRRGQIGGQGNCSAMRFDQLLFCVQNFQVGPNGHLGDAEVLRQLAGTRLAGPLKLQHDLMSPLFRKHV